MHMKYEENNNNLKNNILFQIFSHEQKNKILSGILRETRFPENIIYNKNDKSHAIYLVKDGNIDVYNDNKIIRTYKKGELFGVISVLGGCDRLLTIKSKEKSHLYSISVSSLENSFG